MLKRFNDFVKSINEEFVMSPGILKPEEQQEVETKPGKPMVEPQPPSIIPDQDEENAPAKAVFGEEEEEEGGDIYQQNLQHLAKLLGATVENGSVNYEGKKIIFPAETEMFHVDKKKFKTAEEVVEYLQGAQQGNTRKPLPEVEDRQAIQDLQKEFESKSYKTTRKFRKFN